MLQYFLVRSQEKHCQTVLQTVHSVNLKALNKTEDSSDLIGTSLFLLNNCLQDVYQLMLFYHMSMTAKLTQQ